VYLGFYQAKVSGSEGDQELDLDFLIWDIDLRGEKKLVLFDPIPSCPLFPSDDLSNSSSSLLSTPSSENIVVSPSIDERQRLDQPQVELHQDISSQWELFLKSKKVGAREDKIGTIVALCDKKIQDEEEFASREGLLHFMFSLYSGAVTRFEEKSGELII